MQIGAICDASIVPSKNLGGASSAMIHTCWQWESLRKAKRLKEDGRSFTLTFDEASGGEWGTDNRRNRNHVVIFFYLSNNNPLKLSSRITTLHS